ncbi:MAG: hypothetical protein MUC28_03325 [Planctomycetes bacterium]|jgi:hypothetical protein|nr:hypothetical protein [Planctomycetota bacterium]
MGEKVKCVICGEETDVDSDTSIDFRPYSTDAGDLCRQCYVDIYKKDPMADYDRLIGPGEQA